IRLAAVVGQGLIQGVSGSVAGVYFYQCLRVGTTLAGRARAFRYSLGYGPVFGVIGSLGAQLVLTGKTGLQYPRDFALLYLFGAPCMATVALLSYGFKLVEVPDEPRKPLLAYLSDAVSAYVATPALVLLFVAYFLWYFTLNAMPNLSLYTREAVHREPKEL